MYIYIYMYTYLWAPAWIYAIDLYVCMSACCCVFM